MAATTKTAVVGALVALLGGLDGVHKVEGEEGDGDATWLKDRRPFRTFFRVTCPEEFSQPAGLGAARFDFYDTRIEGWMPDDPERGTAGKWAAVVNDLINALRGSASVAGAARAEYPRVVDEQPEDFADGDKVITCHHIAVELRLRAYTEGA